MRLVAQLLITTMFVSSFWVFAASPASACSCMEIGDEDAFENAYAVFTGELIEVRAPETGSEQASDDPVRFIFATEHSLKGQVFETQSVVTARDGASCGLELTIGGPYLVFARSSDDTEYRLLDGELISGLCSGSRRLTASEDVSVFGDAEPPLPGSSAIGPVTTATGSETQWVKLAVIGLVAISGALAITLFLRRSRAESP